MHFRGIGTATPATRYTKAQCLAATEAPIGTRAWIPAHIGSPKRCLRDNGIESRYLSVASLDEVFSIDANTLAQQISSPMRRSSLRALPCALAQAGLKASDIDAIVISTCTGYVCPGLSGYVVERIGLRADVQAFDLVGQGCAAAAELQLARALLGSGQCEGIALSICVEISSAAMYLDNDPGVLISACLFGDGAGAAVLSRQSGSGQRQLEWIDNASLIEPGQRAALMFESRDGLLRNVLTRAVPALAADYAQQVLRTVLTRHQLDTADIKPGSYAWS